MTIRLRLLLQRTAALAGLALAVWGCRPGPAADIPPDWLWDQDQTLIVPSGGSRSAWNGWVIDADAFVSRESVSRMILWLRTGRKARLQVTYTLNGRPVSLVINKHKALQLEPTLVDKTGEFDAVLIGGRNFLDFFKTSGDLLRIKRIAVDGAEGVRTPHLLSGESVTLFLNPGRGGIEWSGSGAMTFEKRESDSGRLSPVESSRKTRFLSRTIKYEIEMGSPGILTVRADSGRFDVSRFVYKEDAPPPSPEKTPPLEDRPPIFILLADACQAAHLGVYGYPRPTSPRIDEFARDAIVFENAYANASFTRSSVQSLLSGQVPEKSNVGNLTRAAESGLPSLPEFLKVKGYRTSIFTSAVTISPAFGFTKGIDDYFQYLGVLEKTRERKIDLDRFASWLRTPGPLFSYIHFIEPHLPIVAPPPFLDMFAGPKAPKGVPREKRLISELQYAAGKRRLFTPQEVQSVKNDYDSTIAYVDSEVGKALDHIRKAGLYDQGFIIVLADHGEAMWEHRAWGHASNVFEETTHVPLLVKTPASMKLKGRVAKLVQLTDVYPTVLALFGQGLSLPGKSLLEAVKSPEIDDAMTVSQSISEIAQFGMRWRNWYCITSLRLGQDRLYDLATSPLQKAGPDSEPVLRFFQARFLSWLKATGERPPSGEAIDTGKLSPQEIENLKSLGYLKNP